MREPKLQPGPALVQLIAEIDEFKGRWEALKTLSPDRLGNLRRVATIESIGSSTRIEGSKLSDTQIEDLLSRSPGLQSFRTRDEQEVAGYAEAMDLVFEAWARKAWDEKDLYYKALRRTQGTLAGEAPDWEPWVGLFLRCLKRQKDGLAARLEQIRALAGSEAALPELSVQIRQHGKARATWYALP